LKEVPYETPLLLLGALALFERESVSRMALWYQGYLTSGAAMARTKQ
jgi:hypothetical protein